MCAGLSKPEWKEKNGRLITIAVGAFLICLGAFFLVLLYYDVTPWSPPGGEASTLASAYRSYMRTEFPKRGDKFYGLAFALDRRSKAVPILRADVVKCLGAPNLTQGGSDNGILVFTFRPSKATQDWEVFTVLRSGKLAEVGFSPESANDHADYKPYPGEAAPNEQSGVNTRQPLPSEINRTSTAALRNLK